ncbi:MAG: MBL fold metallo-hydrolase [Terriglobales bacterium]
MNKVEQIAPDVIRIPVFIGNCYLVGNRQTWVLVDAGTEGHAKRIQKIAEEHFGTGTRPAAIVLTHGHFDQPAQRARCRMNGTGLFTRMDLRCPI